ncbi:c-type lectin domain-containing protein [Caerostris extrusa]|uniref:C-type lectin domain-containing protein n=1 Tax=Caerostris extrusa TaxID=172846 RepID=A0AAV4NM42_CAEEX|nr:c-type lectin domain-containing protein [Caerostris extrusa]
MEDTSVKCGSAQVEAYPPCPSDWTGGNEYHCFLFLSGVTSFEEARRSCLAMDTRGKLGELSHLVDQQEGSFWPPGFCLKTFPACGWWEVHAGEKDDCCKTLVKNDDFLDERDCAEETLTSAVCLRDHKGEGSRMRISKVQASGDGASASVAWTYEGVGWKTDKLQVKLWAESEDSPKVLTFSTLEDVFTLKDLQPGTLYSVLLRPAPNIRTDEFTYKFVIISFPEDGVFGALLTPIRMSVYYVIWSGRAKVTWSEAQTYSVSGDIKKANKYTVSYQTEASDAQMEEITVESDPPDYMEQDSSGVFTAYQVMMDSPRNWSEAEVDCQQRSGHLTSLLSEAEGKTLLKVLPSRDAQVWTGAKLKRNGTSLWTDGNRMTYLPMAKKLGVSGSRTRAVGPSTKLEG